ncbi:hypothetical protein [Flavilitoribacter nigricans]|uniref:Uncharacterized protein n=1 Tax=Flavilitoribacter nigricans (strain ATCC 23147 / DSM 23189 / NBRC 102662 / NCIMB 1420 / SS-2) TaxID=1122177 RepID=A0A2D0NER7_FLAN2|nr:hypothetical protein [Flavilitoribacter nigricans]PHN06992.1 hypothetical protein CRP01_08505 [Flavilitoribacter nigricans DSM 23189 = NBRC 102662]
MKELESYNITEIRILPKKPDYPINLTLDPIIVKVSDQIEAIVSNLKNSELAAHGKNPNRYWEMVLFLGILSPDELDIKNKKNIVLEFEYIDSGLYFEMSGVMGYQTFLCSMKLRQIFEEIAFFKEPLGGNR